MDPGPKSGSLVYIKIKIMKNPTDPDPCHSKANKQKRRLRLSEALVRLRTELSSVYCKV